MRIAFAAIVLGLVSLSTTAEADCGKRAVISMKGADGVTMGIRISEAQFEKAPPWSPGHGEPPLSISRVVQIAENWAKTRYRGFDSAKIHNVSLTEFGCADERKHWYYLVQFLPIKDGKSTFSGDFAAVLLDGTLVGPSKLDNAF